MTAYNAIHMFYAVYLSEMYLSSDTPLNDKKLVVRGYNLMTSDQPSNTKHGRVCIYYKQMLPLIHYNVSISKDSISE